MVYTTQMLKDKYSAYTNVHDKIRRECTSGQLVKIKRDLYEDDPGVPAFYLASYICSPSYISFEYVLSSCGLIPEYSPVVTCASFGKNKTKTFNTPVGSYIYHDVPANVFFEDVRPMTENGYSILMALPEKALCDQLYYIRQTGSLSEFEQLLTEDLRIDTEVLFSIDTDEIKRLAGLYKRSNLAFLVKYIDRKKG